MMYYTKSFMTLLSSEWYEFEHDTWCIFRNTLLALVYMHLIHYKVTLKLIQSYKISWITLLVLYDGIIREKGGPGVSHYEHWFCDVYWEEWDLAAAFYSTKKYWSQLKLLLVKGQCPCVIPFYVRFSLAFIGSLWWHYKTYKNGISSPILNQSHYLYTSDEIVNIFRAMFRIYQRFALILSRIAAR